MASARPSECDEPTRGRPVTGAVKASHTETVPGRLPVTTASTSNTSSASCHASISESASPYCSRASTPISRRRRATRGPAASSPRSGWPQQSTSISGYALDFHKVRGAGDARIVVAHGVLALGRDLIQRQSGELRHEMPQVVLDAFLILRGGRHDLRVQDQTALVHLVAMIEHAAGG